MIHYIHLPHTKRKWIMPVADKKQNPTSLSSHPADTLLPHWQVSLEGEWSRHEKYRILNVFQRISQQSGRKPIPEIFNHKSTAIHHSGRAGRVGRTRGGDIFLDDSWTDWTFAHELGHRWNNAWNRMPEKRLRRIIGAGKVEWLKKGLRQFEKWLELALKSLGFKSRLDWRALWYSPGKAPPPCGVDRNFNASEDLAESFAAIIFQKDALNRARRAAERIGSLDESWNWPSMYPDFIATPRGQSLKTLLNHLSPKENNPQQAKRPSAKDQ
ncbi:MAG: hypothetical protein ACOCYU_01910 [Brevefilum sp.]